MSLFSSKKMKSLSEIKTFCEKCPSEGLKDLFSLDLQVRSRFEEIHSGAEPNMEGAFRRRNDKEEFLKFYDVNFKTEVIRDRLCRWTRRLFHKKDRS